MPRWEIGFGNVGKSASPGFVFLAQPTQLALDEGVPLAEFQFGTSFVIYCLFPLRRLLRCHLFRHEPRIVAAVEEDHAVKFIALYGPAPALGRIHLVVAVPGPFDGWLAVPCGQAAVHLSLDVAKVKGRADLCQNSM